MKYFNNIKSAEELRTTYRALCLKMHPDRGGKEEEFKAMQGEFETLKRLYQNGTTYTRTAGTRETDEERKRREDEARREREEWARWEAEEKKRREQEEREKAERIRKDQEESRAAVRAWSSILERVEIDKTGTKARYYRFDDKKQAAAFVAATKRNIIKVINHYFPGLKVKVTISGEIWKEKFSISWEDGPNEKELRDTCKELLFFVPASFCCAGPGEDYGDYEERKESAPWREAYGQALGDVDSFDTVRTLSEEGKKQADELAARYFKNFDPQADKFAATLEELGELAKAAGFSESTNLTDLFCTLTGQYYADLCGFWSDITGEIGRRQLRRMMAEYITVNVTPKEKAPEFSPTFGPAYKAIKKALGLKVFFIDTNDGRKNVEQEKTIFEAAELLANGEAVNIGQRYHWDDDPVIYGVERGGYKTQLKRAEKFEAVGIILEAPRCFNTYNKIKAEGIKAETLEALRREAQDIERQRKEFEDRQNGTQKADCETTAANTDNSPREAHNAASGNESDEAPADGLELVEIAGGVAVTGDSHTTFKNRKAIKAHGARWNDAAKQWQATTADDAQSLRAWFALRDGEAEQPAPTQEEPKEEPQQEERKAEKAEGVKCVEVIINEFGTVKIGDRVTNGRVTGSFLYSDGEIIVILDDELRVYEADAQRVRKADNPTEKIHFSPDDCPEFESFGKTA